MSYILDTNIILRLRDQDNVRHQECIAAVDALKDRGEALFVCAQVLTEFWVVATRPTDVNGMGLGQLEAAAELAGIRAAFPCLVELPDMADRWKAVAVGLGVLGRQAHDARIVALMLAHGIGRILTLNPGDFSRYAGIVPITPLDAIR